MPDTEIPQEVTATITEGAQAEETVQPAAAEGATAEEAPKEGEAAAEVKPDAPKPEDEATKQRNRENAERRIEKKRLRELELENARLQGFNEALKTGGKTEHQDTAEVFPEQRPTQKEDEPYEDFILRLQDWNLEKRIWSADRAEKRTQQKTQQEELQTRVLTQREKGEAKYEDFNEVVHKDLPISEPMAKALIRSEFGEDIAYYLGQNPKEAARIASLLDPAEQGMEIGLIGASFKSGSLQAKPAVKRISTAPEPAPRVKANAGGSSTEPPKNMEDYARWRG